MFEPIRARLLIWHALVLVVVFAALGVVAGVRLWQGALRAVDRELVAAARGLADALQPAPGGAYDLNLTDDQRALFNLSKGALYYVIWDERGRLIDRSEPDIAPTWPDDEIARTRAGRREISLIGARRARVLVGCSLTPVRAELRRSLWLLAAAGAVSLAIALAGAWFLTGRALAPIQAAFERQTRFTADASHELRTPVTNALTEAAWALKRPRAPEEYRESLQICLRAAERMRGVIEALLTLARADAGTEILRTAPVDLQAVVAEVIIAHARAARERRVTLDVDTESVVVEGDAERLRDMLSNLLSNAIQYNREGGQALVRLRRVDGVASLEVRDTGIGIGADDLPQVFDRFYRADRARSRAAGGSGLGLAIAKRVVDSHGGTIACSSTPGIGTTFTIAFPQRSA